MIEIIIRRYPAKKREYEEYISDVMGAAFVSNHDTNDGDDYTKPRSETEAKALKLTSVYAEKLKKEIEAVEYAYNNLSSEEKKVMRERYWTIRYRNKPYTKMINCNYSERQMHRIIKKIITQVGRHIGEIKNV
ncbi:MAG: hypothetical protein IJ716_08235 [Lachnospiraceae bacterium]|nr:hypothetical protein [Lachnospiraceae bacterium]MBR1852670.1 hypothetical protein [Lachnospiraceae bacterium]